jgi:hypothetical protein
MMTTANTQIGRSSIFMESNRWGSNSGARALEHRIQVNLTWALSASMIRGRIVNIIYIYTIYNIYIYVYYINIIIYIYTVYTYVYVYTSLVISFGSKTCLLIPNDPHPHRCCLVPKPSAIHRRLTLDFVEFVSWYPVMLSCWPCENWTCLLQPPKLADSGHWGFIVWSYPKRHDLGSESQKLQGYCEMYN